MNYIDKVGKKIAEVFETESSKADTMAVIQELFEKELKASFKNGIEVGEKRTSKKKKDTSWE